MSLAISLDTALQEKVQQMVALKHATLDSIVHQALCEYVEREEKKIAFQQDGLHLTSDEIMNWLNTWGTKQETEIPKCHK